MGRGLSCGGVFEFRVDGSGSLLVLLILLNSVLSDLLAFNIQSCLSRGVEAELGVLAENTYLLVVVNQLEGLVKGT